MTGPGTAEQWRKSLEGVTRSQFVSRHPYAFLVWAVGQSGDVTPLAAPPQLSFHTQVHGGPARAGLIAGGATEGVLVIPLKKAPGNPFPDRISVGRAPNCDIVFRDPSVSKLHGHFRDVTADSAVFTDAKSANGTRLNSAAMVSGEAVEVKSFSYLSLGRVRVQLLSSADVYDWL
ncbi:MAG: hypothetical protein JWN48_2194 [Myxococcaceae bacterium]|nr:hypothetical protein [Myxococcaceae bacterium]